MRTTRTALLLTAATGILFAPSASAGWLRIVDIDMPDFPPQQRDTCPPLGIAFATTASMGDLAKGLGEALDDSLFCEVRANNVAVGYTFERYRYTPDYPWLEGHAGIEAEVAADGVVELVSGNAAAVAVGYIFCECNLFARITATLTSSAAETSSDLLGTLALRIEGVSASVPIPVASGHGVFPDTDVDTDAADECTDTFSLKLKSRAQIQVYADEDLFQAGKSTACMLASSRVVILLSDCP